MNVLSIPDEKKLFPEKGWKDPKLVWIHGESLLVLEYMY